ncbi:Uncharacterized OsmC-related protein [Sanguibacter gelidistatuariae]|uniref:Uncharacterized OsmC-related protein n=1 Tax=Sanguibacter gelidistatuariae TaxID=1814289 RepID=A0A1G6Q4T8_9MICO|nr:OsmC family protein [Sanguibacter gelidistatuariae]SDC86647.1 Uncharacterized OsmC-related protein [Sanguibacter gelidistatuariae]
MTDALATAPQTDASTPAPEQAPEQPALWIERTGTRRYVGYSERGGVVQIGGAGAEETFTPGELLKIALASCTGLASDAAFARRLGDDYPATIHVSGVNKRDEDRYPELVERLEVDLSALDEAARERLITVVTRAIDQSCTVGRTLKAGATIELSIESVGAPDGAGA